MTTSTIRRRGGDASVGWDSVPTFFAKGSGRSPNLRIARLLVLVAVCGAASVVSACPLCQGPSITLSERLAKSDAVVLATWVEGQKPSGKTFGNTTFSVVEVARMPTQGKEILAKGSKFIEPRFRTGKRGDLWLLFGQKDDEGIDWLTAMQGSRTAYKYVADAPSPKQPAVERLAYYLRFLESPDQTISNDAYGEFANAPWEEIVQVQEKFDREKLRKWVTSPDTHPTRLGLYGLLLGLCGNADDAELMRKKIEEPSGMDYRLGIDGVTCGYLLLTGEPGLDLIDKIKLQAKDAGKEETYSAVRAVRFMWDYGADRISKERLRQSMREVLNRSELADLAIADLARWEDWSIHERLMRLYGKPGYDDVRTKKAIVCFLVVATKAKPEVRTSLDKLREHDPKFVKDTEAFFRR